MKNAVVLEQPELNVTVSLGQNPIKVVDGKLGVDVVLRVTPVIQTKNSIPLKACFVVDCSGSMNEPASHQTIMSKIEAVRTALLNIVKKMSPKDQIRVIGFSDDAFQIIPWTVIGNANLAAITSTLEAELKARSGTHFKNALCMSLETGLTGDGSPNVVFLTDGQSSDRGNDHPFLVKYADTLRAKNISLVVYGTGPNYEQHLLQQLAVRTGNGSLMYHVLSVQDLESHLTGELAFRHGLCLENVRIRVFHHASEFRDVYRFIPQECKLEKRDPKETEHGDGGHFLQENDTGFQSACGAVDHLRGQTFLFHLEVPDETFDKACLFYVEVTGNKPGEPPFVHTLSIPAERTELDSSVPTNPEVEACKLMVEATKAVNACDYDRGAKIYQRMGRRDLAETLIQIATAGEDAASTSRGTQSFASSASSVILSQEMMDELRAKLGEKP